MTAIAASTTAARVPMWAHLAALPVSTYVTEGLAKIHGFEVLRHGTTMPNFLNILKKGTDPAKGGTGTTGYADGGQRPDLKGMFHVFKDSDAHASCCPIVIGHIFKRTNPRLHAFMSGGSILAYTKAPLAVRIALGIILGLANAIFTPTLRFVYRKSEIETMFKNDPEYCNLAYQTKEALPNHRIGLIGLCQHITTEDARRSWKENPLRVLFGVIQLIIGIALTVLGVGLVL